MSDLAYLLIGTSSMVSMMFTIILFVYMFQRKLASKSKAYAEIEKLMQKQELQSAYFVIEGQEQERKRIASELHDNVGSVLATLKIYSDIVLNNSDMSEILRLNKKINGLADNLTGEIRKLSHELDLSALSGFGLKVAVQQLCEALNESGKVQVDFILDIQKPIAEEVSLHFYRIIQQLFTNTLKHAMATKVRIEISLIQNDVILIYEDNGKGFDIKNISSDGMGLKSIKSRVARINGKITMDSTDKGTTYIIESNNYERSNDLHS